MTRPLETPGDVPATTVLRRLRPDEWPVALDLRVAALSGSPTAFGSTVERERSLSTDAWHGRLSGSAWVVAYDGAQPMGMACGVRGGSPDDLELTGVWVSRAHRGRGVGDALVLAVRDWARAQGARRLTLEVVAGNAQAIALYRRHGFRVTDGVGVARRCSPADVVMCLDLSKVTPGPRQEQGRGQA